MTRHLCPCCEQFDAHDQQLANGNTVRICKACGWHMAIQPGQDVVPLVSCVQNGEVAVSLALPRSGSDPDA